ncbi:hypothetical protein M0R45_026867 [Rubus argutus]|uniref:Uncharacterized protein n=1 Tax=Rubus argutus TaxID=59490 RepID=A0AAW1WZ71_RUBAR
MRAKSQPQEAVFQLEGLKPYRPLSPELRHCRQSPSLTSSSRACLCPRDQELHRAHHYQPRRSPTLLCPGLCLLCRCSLSLTTPPVAPTTGAPKKPPLPFTKIDLPSPIEPVLNFNHRTRVDDACLSLSPLSTPIVFPRDCPARAFSPQHSSPLFPDLLCPVRSICTASHQPHLSALLDASPHFTDPAMASLDVAASPISAGHHSRPHLKPCTHTVSSKFSAKRKKMN